MVVPANHPIIAIIKAGKLTSYNHGFGPATLAVTDGLWSEKNWVRLREAKGRNMERVVLEQSFRYDKSLRKFWNKFQVVAYEIKLHLLGILRDLRQPGQTTSWNVGWAIRRMTTCGKTQGCFAALGDHWRMVWNHDQALLMLNSLILNTCNWSTTMVVTYD